MRLLPPALLLLTISLAACEQRSDKSPPPTPLVDPLPPVDPSKTIEGTLHVAGMTCSGCEYNVASALRLVDGVLEAEAEHTSGAARVRFDPARTTLALLAEAVRTTGYVVAPVEKSVEESD